MESAVVKVNNTQIYLIEMAEKLNKLSHAYKEVTNGWCHKWGFHSQNAAKMFFSEFIPAIPNDYCKQRIFVTSLSKIRWVHSEASF